MRARRSTTVRGGSMVHAVRHAVALVVCCVAIAAPAARAQEPTPIPDQLVRSDEVRMHRHHYQRPFVRLWIEQTLFLAGGTAWYWLDKDFNARDWDYNSWTRRFSLEAIRFDNNEFSTNLVFHPLSGSAFHAFARANGFGIGASFGVSFLTSSSWEGLIEFREKFSINDLIATPGAGAPMGEFFHHLGNYLHHVHSPRSRGLGHRIMAWTFGLPTTFHRRLDRLAPNPEFVPRFETRFRVSYGVESFRPRGADAFPVHALSFEGAITDFSRDGLPTEDFRYFHDGEFVTFRLRTEWLADRPGMDLSSDVVAFGAVRRRGDGVTAPMRELAIGGEIGFLYQRREWRGFVDNYGVVELLGLSIDHHRVRDRLDFRMRVRAAPTFAAVSAPGLAAWEAANPGVMGKSVLDNWGYYNAFGASLRAEADLAYGPLSVGGRFALGYANSVEHVDRKQEEVVIDQRATERRATWEAHARVRLLRNRGLTLGLEVRGLRSRSHLDGISTDRQFVSLGASIATAH